MENIRPFKIQKIQVYRSKNPCFPLLEFGFYKKPPPFSNVHISQHLFWCDYTFSFHMAFFCLLFFSSVSNHYIYTDHLYTLLCKLSTDVTACLQTT